MRSQEWGTPRALFRELDHEHGPFVLDAAASSERHLCERYFTRETDGLRSSWSPGPVFCNPPFGDCGRWVQKAIKEWEVRGVASVLVLPSRTGARWFHDLMEHGDVSVRFLRGRVEYVRPEGSPKSRVPFASIVAAVGCADE